jgi:hypothetical protein
MIMPQRFGIDERRLTRRALPSWLCHTAGVFASFASAFFAVQLYFKRRNASGRYAHAFPSSQRPTPPRAIATQRMTAAPPHASQCRPLTTPRCSCRGPALRLTPTLPHPALRPPCPAAHGRRPTARCQRPGDVEQIVSKVGLMLPRRTSAVPHCTPASPSGRPDRPVLGAPGPARPQGVEALDRRGAA